MTRSKEWFYGQCVAMVRDTDDLAGIAFRALELGVEGIDNTRGHMNHSVGVAQQFLQENPDIRDEINDLNVEPVNLNIPANAHIRLTFVDWITPRTGDFGRVAMHDFGYNYDTFKSVVTPRLGGSRVDGGGGDNEFLIALRLAAHFVQ